jgi:D-glycero-D-manno-heptose 1,7-bisphosphate phosphatase
MNRPAVFFDRDNTLIANDGYLGDPAQVILIAGAADAIARVRALGYAVVVVSNQSGVARGLFGEDAVRAVNERMKAMLVAANPKAQIDRHEYCPYHPEGVVEAYRKDSPLRKPQPGMLRAAAETLGVDLARSWIIGDAPRDIQAGKAAGCRTILFIDPQIISSPAAGESAVMMPDYTVTSLHDAVDIIEGELPPPFAKPPGPSPANLATVAAKAVAAAASPVGVARAAQNPAARPLQAVPPAKPDSSSPPNERLVHLAEQILAELRRSGDIAPDDFSVSKLLAGVSQVIVLAILFLGYLQVRNDTAWLEVYVLLALTLQTMTIALLIMSRQR